jgi:hypothetical protein
VPEPGTFAAKLTIKRTFRAKLKRARSIRAILVAVCADASGAQPSAQRRVTLRR